jgi:NTP pyrophosphatase (non-canonical NTP hydrolase)
MTIPDTYDPIADVLQLIGWLNSKNGLDVNERALRILKLTEEVGEVAEALGALTGQNPRKEIGTVRILLNELADTAVTALVAAGSLADDIDPGVVRRRLMWAMAEYSGTAPWSTRRLGSRRRSAVLDPFSAAGTYEPFDHAHILVSGWPPHRNPLLAPEIVAVSKVTRAAGRVATAFDQRRAWRFGDHLGLSLTLCFAAATAIMAMVDIGGDAVVARGAFVVKMQHLVAHIDVDGGAG